MIRYCFFCIVFFFLGLFLHADTYTEVTGRGLFIDTVPSGATVFIDGVERGTTPFTASSIRSGEYTIRISKEGYIERHFNAIVRLDSRLEIVLDLEQAKGHITLELYLDSDILASLPFNVFISADGVNIPLTHHITGPVYLQEISLAAGWRTITVEAFGWERINRRILVEEGSNQRLELHLVPAALDISNAVLRRERFNPYNSGALGRTEIIYKVNAPGSGLVELLDSQGIIIYTRTLEPFTAWQQQFVWDGRNDSGIIVSDGTYTIRLRTWGNDEDEAANVTFAVQVDSSIVLRPHTITSASSGLFLAASPEILPLFSFQIEGSFLAGRPFKLEAGKSLPFALGLRLSIVENLEAAAAFNMNPDFSADADWGLGISLKWVFFRPLNSREQGFSLKEAIGLAAELSYGWATYGPYTAFGMGTGAALRLPVMYRFLYGETKDYGIYSLDLLLSPYMLWAGEDGYPDNMVPRLGIGGGILFCYGNIAAGFSLRWDYVPETKTDGPFMSALEFKFFPSNFTLSITGGYWHSVNSKNYGFFGGAGLGVMF